MKNLVQMVAALFAGAGFSTGAEAESFTYTVADMPSATDVTVSAHDASGATMAATAFKLQMAFTYRSGAIEKGVFQCINWRTPRDVTNRIFICNGAIGEDKYAATGSILSNDKGAPMYWGVFEGVSGKRAGKRATITQIGPNGEGAWED